MSLAHEPSSPSRPAPRSLTREELAGPLSEYPPIMTPDEAARLLRVSKSTLYHHVSRGQYRAAVKRGKPLRFWRDRLVREFFRR